MAEIYKITNPKGKIYVGQAVDYTTRVKSYSKLNKPVIGPKLYNSIKKYGWENHKFEVIEECKEEILDEKEIFWIAKYNSVEDGLNLTYGGKGGRPSQETKDKKSKSMTGKIMSPETRKRMSEAKKGHSMYNKEWRNKMEKVWKSPSTVAKPIIQLNKDGEIVREWNSSREASLTLNIGKSSLSSALNGTYKTAGGYIWEFKKIK